MFQDDFNTISILYTIYKYFKQLNFLHKLFKKRNTKMLVTF